MTTQAIQKQVIEFFKNTPFRKSYAIEFDGVAYRSGTTVFREVYVSFERRKVKFTYGAPLTNDTKREWRYETPDELMCLLPKDEQDFDKKLWGHA